MLVHNLKRTLKDWDESVEWQTPTDTKHGLLTTSAAFIRAKNEGKNPTEIATDLNTNLISYLNTKMPEFTSVTIGPYINIVLNNVGFQKILESAPELFVEQDERNVMYEYLGLNVAKRPHLGHLRNMIIGDALRCLLALKYPNMTTDHHWGDWGVQFGILLWAFKENVDQEAYEQDPIEELSRLYVWGNAQKEITPDWDLLVRQEFIALEAGDETRKKLWEEWVRISQESIQQEFDIWNIPDTDLHQGESYYEPVMKELTAYLDANDIWEKDGDARYFEFETIADSWPDLSQEDAARIKNYGRAYCISSNGYTTYVYRDIATRLQWARDYKTDLAITVTGSEQQHNFNQAFSAIAYLATRDDFSTLFGEHTASRLTLSSLIHVPYGFLTLTSGKMSTREGNVILIPDIRAQTKDAVIQSLSERESRISTDDEQAIDTLVMASLKWSEVSRDRLTDVVMDPQKAVQFEGNTGIYQLYSYARIAGIVRELGSAPERGDAETLSDEEKQILQQLLETSTVIEQSIATYKPNILSEHVYNLNQSMNTWYANTSVKNEANETRRATLLRLCELFCQVQKQSLQLLGIDVLEQM